MIKETIQNNKELQQILQSLPDPLIEGQEPTNDISFKWVDKNEDLKSIEEGIPIIQFGTFVKARSLEMEFRLLRRLTESQWHNDELKDYLPAINKLNRNTYLRYSSVVPFKHSEVRVKVNEKNNLNDSFEDTEDGSVQTYINANFINTAFDEQKYFIATQGPLLSTMSNFWKMIWQQDVNLILMLCSLKENNKAECDQYWPEPGKIMEFIPKEIKEPNQANQPKEPEYSLKIEPQAETSLADGLIQRIFILTKINKDETAFKKEIIQIQWKGWPDHGIPDESGSAAISQILELLIKQYINYRSNKVAVHCSAGVGRTGTIICLFNILMTYCKFYPDLRKDLNENLQDIDYYRKYRISIFGAVRRLREQRWGMVNSQEQYAYIYKFFEKLFDDEKFLHSIDSIFME